MVSTSGGMMVYALPLVCSFSLYFALFFILCVAFFNYYLFILFYFNVTGANDVYEGRILDLRHLFWEYLSN